MTAPYERLESESKQAFEAFTIYRDMGLARSITKVAQKCTKNESLLKRWSSKYEWVDRAAAYDKEMDRIAILENEQQKREMVKEHNEVARMMLHKVKAGTEAIKPETLTANELAKLFDISVKVERLSRGESTDISEVSHSGEVNDEQSIFKRVDQYAEVYKKLSRRGLSSSVDEGNGDRE